MKNPDPNQTGTSASKPTTLAPDPALEAEPQPSQVPVEKPAHDPSTIVVEHNDQDPNSPTYREPERDEV